MHNALINFDPIKFLEVDTTQYTTSALSELRMELNSKIGEYILIKISKDLSKEQLKNLKDITDGDKLFEELRVKIPDLNSIILTELENFKSDYWAEAK